MELLNVALQGTLEEFQKESLRWLERRIGFDGLIWGGGERQKNGVLAINKFLLAGRPEGLVLDYPTAAPADPVSTNFLASPTRLQNVSTHKFYTHPTQRGIREYLDHYHVRHLQLVGSVTPATSTYSWIVCYREDERRAFSPEQEAAANNAISMTLLGEQLQLAAHRQLAMEELINASPDQSQELLDLSPRQLQVLHYIEQGWSNKLIARQLAISENTLKTHMKNLFRALGVHSRSQALIAGRTMRLRAQNTEQKALKISS